MTAPLSPPASPRLNALSHAIARGDADVLSSFWEEIRTRGTPLIEPLADARGRKLVTFVWRDDHAARVTLIGLLTDRAHSALTRLPGTDVWFVSCVVDDDIRATYQFFAEPSDPGWTAPTDPTQRLMQYRHDPHNPRTYVFERDEEDPDGFELTRSVLEMPGAPAQPDNARSPAAPAGAVEMHRLKSAVLGNERRVWIYKPAGYRPDRAHPYDALLLFDGTGFARMSPLPTVLDNLIASGRVPPLVAVMPCSLSQTKRLQELLLHAPFNRFLAEELMPWAHDTFGLSAVPARTVVAGASAGGLAAAYAAFEHPELFGNVLSLSGAFAYAPGMLEPSWRGEYEWLTRRIAVSERRSVRFYLCAGRLETHSLRDVGAAPHLVAANRRLHAVLEDRGYSAWLREFPGGHDMISWQGEIPKGLATLLGGDSDSEGE